MPMDIRARVDKLVRKYKTRNPLEMIKGMNAIVVFYPLHGVRGFYQYFQRNNIIYIDESLSDADKLFVLAHEMGHMILHRKSNAIFMDTKTHFKTTRYETEANKFAIELLLDTNTLNEYIESGYSKEQISRITGYSINLIDLKLRD